MPFAPAVDIKAAYMYPLGRLFEVGAGAGVGLSTIIHTETEARTSSNKTFEEKGGFRSPSIPVFVIGKMKCFDRADTPFFKLEAGHRLAKVEDGYGGFFNPYIYHIIPSVGCELGLGKHSLAFEVGFEYMSYKKTHQAENTDNLISGGEVTASANNFNGVYLAATFAF